MMLQNVYDHAMQTYKREGEETEGEKVVAGIRTAPECDSKRHVKLLQSYHCLVVSLLTFGIVFYHWQ